MTVGTHAAFAGAVALLCGASPSSLPLLALGSALPDIDHPQSFLGRIFFFLSIPLNKRFGHRKTIHGYPLWGLVTVLGVFWDPLLWLGLGAISHLYLDSFNLKGVQALMPFSEKVLVLFDRKYRIVAGSRKELVLLSVLLVAAWGGGYIGKLGGLAGLIAHATGSYQMAYGKYMEQGTRICYMEGKLRYKNGSIEEGSWLVIGKEGERDGVALWDDKGKRIIHAPEEAEFLRVKLRVTKERWDTMRLAGWAKTKSPAYFYDGSKWKYAEPGDTVFGYVLAKSLEIEAGREW
jgi:inner membrane protein